MRTFSFQSFDALTQTVQELGLQLPLRKNEESLKILQKPLPLCGHIIPNRILLQPMEGCDGATDGAPGGLTLRRYRRFASGGAGLLWVEACAVRPEGRANPRQLMLTKKNLSQFQKMAEEIREISLRDI